MLKYLHQLTVLTVLLLIISAFTICPTMAEHVTSTSSSVPSIDTSQAIRDLSLDENDVFYVFTVDGQQGIVHERKLGDEDGGLSRVEDVIIGDQCAALVSDTPEQTIVAITGGYLLTFDKNQKLITLSDSQSQGSNEEEALVIAANEQIDEALVSVTQSQSDSDGDSWLSIIASLVPFSAQTVVKAGTLVCLTCVNPMLGAGYFVSAYLIGSANAIAFAVIPAVAVGLGEVALKITAGVAIGAVALETLKKIDTFDTDGYGYFVSEYMDNNQKQHFYKFRYKGEEKGTAEYIGEVNVIDGVFTNLADTIIKFRGDTIKKIESFKVYFKSIYGKFAEKIIHDFEISKKDTAAVTAKWYSISDIKNVNKKEEISEKEALEKLKKCKNDKDKNGNEIIVFIQGESREECEKLAKEASGNNKRPFLHDKNVKCEINHQYPHFHPADENGDKCATHCFWIPSKQSMKDEL